MPSPGQIKRILVYIEKHAKDIVKEYPTLSWIAGSALAGTASGTATHYIITGTDSALALAKAKLAANQHKHTVEHHQ
jgi:hypothetical protein